VIAKSVLVGGCNWLLYKEDFCGEVRREERR